MSKKLWSVQTIWNTGYENTDKAKKRDYLSASDVGKSDLDIFLKCQGVEVSNPFPLRLYRIFDAGNFFEELVCSIFDVAGLVVERQIFVEIPATDTELRVLGYADVMLGGKPDWDKVMEAIDADKGMPEFLKRKTRNMFNDLRERFPDGLPEILCEIKSVNSNAFWSHNNIDEETGYFKGYDHHKMQLFTYIKAKKLEFGRLFYISRDDFCLMECDVFYTEKMNDMWLEDVRRKTAIIKSGIQPPTPPDKLFNENAKSPHYPNGKWEANWEMARSPYLTYVTGLEADDWKSKVEQEVKDLNEELKKQARAEISRVKAEAKAREKELSKLDKNIVKGGESQ